MTVPSHPVQGINRICFGTRLGRLAWPHVTGGMDTEPPDDGSMGGGDESEQGIIQKMHFLTEDLLKKKTRWSSEKKQIQRVLFLALIFILSDLTFLSVSAESTQEALMMVVKPKNILAVRQDKSLKQGWEVHSFWGGWM